MLCASKLLCLYQWHYPISQTPTLKIWKVSLTQSSVSFSGNYSFKLSLWSTHSFLFLAWLILLWQLSIWTPWLLLSFLSNSPSCSLKTNSPKTCLSSCDYLNNLLLAFCFLLHQKCAQWNSDTLRIKFIPTIFPMIHHIMTFKSNQAFSSLKHVIFILTL